MQGQTLKGHLDMLVLATVANGATHGYVVIESLREKSGGAFDLPEGTIYPVLHRLEDAGLLKSHWAGTGRRRRVYKVTRAGRRHLEQAEGEWGAFTRAVGAVLEGTT